jgi:uncharacterized protein YjiS (DUF1127 family)
MEAAMNDPSTSRAPHQSARAGTPVLTTLRSTIATWRWRIQFRWELEQKSKTSLHLFDDIGLTRRQIEAEIAKPFWQA